MKKTKIFLVASLIFFTGLNLAGAQEDFCDSAPTTVTSSTLRRSSTPNLEVCTLQEALNDEGASLRVDGIYGPATEQAVRNYQQANRLTVDGIAGPETLRSLLLTGSPTGGTPPGGGRVTCERGFHFQNGLCLPDSQFNQGIASKTSIGSLLIEVIRILLTIAGVIAVLFIIIGGFQYVTSAGNEERAEKGKKTLINSIIGLAAIILSYLIVQVILNTLTSSRAPF